MNSPQFALDRPFQLLRRFCNGELDGRPLMAHYDGLKAGQSRFKHASKIVALRFMSVRIAEMGLYSCNPIGESGYRALHAGMDKTHDIFASRDVVVGMDLNLHAPPPLQTCKVFPHSDR